MEHAGCAAQRNAGVPGPHVPSQVAHGTCRCPWHSLHGGAVAFCARGGTRRVKKCSRTRALAGWRRTRRMRTAARTTEVTSAEPPKMVAALSAKEPTMARSMTAVPRAGGIGLSPSAGRRHTQTPADTLGCAQPVAARSARSHSSPEDAASRERCWRADAKQAVPAARQQRPGEPRLRPRRRARERRPEGACTSGPASWACCRSRLQGAAAGEARMALR